MEKRQEKTSKWVVIKFTEEEYKALSEAGKYTALSESALVKMLLVFRLKELKEKDTMNFEYRIDETYNKETYKKISFAMEGENQKILMDLLNCTPLTVSAFIKGIISPCVEQINKNKRWGMEA